MPVTALKAYIQVTAGVIPGVPMGEHARRWEYTSGDHESDLRLPKDKPTKFSAMLEEAHRYAMSASNPAYLNWVRVEWCWI